MSKSTKLPSVANVSVYNIFQCSKLSNYIQSSLTFYGPRLFYTWKTGEVNLKMLDLWEIKHAR